MGMRVPPILCNRYDLKIGAGRIYFKMVPLISIIMSMAVYLIFIFFILGMRHRDRTDLLNGLQTMSVKKLSDLYIKLKEENSLEELFETCSSLREDECNIISKIKEEKAGKLLLIFF